MTTNNDDPVCHICQTGRAIGIGLGYSNPTRWLCIDCSALVGDIKRIKRMDAYESKALTAVDTIAGDYAAEHGADIAKYDELTRRMFWKTIIQGYGRELRAEIREGVPF